MPSIVCTQSTALLSMRELSVYMSEDTGLDISHEVYGGREGQTACWGKKYVVSGQQLSACRGKLRRVGATITACRGKLRRVGANYGVSGQITACRGNLRLVEANYGMSGTNYVVSRQITSCRGKLRRVGANYVVSGANYDVSGQFTSCRGKLRRHPCPQTSHDSSSTVYS